MTEEEARQKAEAWAVKYKPADKSIFNLELYAQKAYMQCYHDMTQGAPDGWCAWHYKNGWLIKEKDFELISKDHQTHKETLAIWKLKREQRFGLNQSEVLKVGDDMLMYGGWRIKPVRLLEVKGV